MCKIESINVYIISLDCKDTINYLRICYWCSASRQIGVKRIVKTCAVKFIQGNETSFINSNSETMSNKRLNLVSLCTRRA